MDCLRFSVDVPVHIYSLSAGGGGGGGGGGSSLACAADAVFWLFSFFFSAFLCFSVTDSSQATLIIPHSEFQLIVKGSLV